ncbi:MAG: cytidine deaminase [Mycoplasmoidaceae bacterium]
MELENIFIELNNLLEKSYSPYSKFKVAAIVEGEDGKFYKGVNVENASFGATICAERTAFSSAVTYGNKRMKNLYLLTSSDNYIFPCGICLQFISEFLDSESDIYIFCKNSKYKKYKLSDLILLAFDKKELPDE